MIIPVNLGSRSYRIIVESGALDTVGARLAELRGGPPTAPGSRAAVPRLSGQAGAARQPRLVLCDPTTTRTLSQREFSSGLAEIVKHGIVLDAAYFAEVERDAAALCARDLPVVERIIGGSCRLKAGIVERDERESELRHVLNYGHTIGHAPEAVTG